MTTQKVRKAVIAAAGFGTRLLPQTKAMPKEMMPLVDKPIIQHVVEELVAAGIEDIIIVTGYHKRAIEDHFDLMSADLRANLQTGQKDSLLNEIDKISTLANFAYVRQHKGPYGSGTPIMNVAHLVGDEPFIYTFADDLILTKPNRFAQMIALHEQHNGSILPCITIEKDEDFEKYGVLDGQEVNDNVIKISNIVEKPGRANAPSNFASVGGYLLTPDVFNYINKGLDKLQPGDEFFLTRYVLQPMVEDGLAFFGCKLNDSRYYDTGNKLGYLKTVVDFALMHDDIRQDFADYLRKLNS